MATALRKLTGVGGDVRKISRLLQAKAPENHMLAYITPEEAQLLKDRGGSGRPHADTGVPSFAEEDLDMGPPISAAEISGPPQPIRGDTDVPIPNFQQVVADNPNLYPPYAIGPGNPNSTVFDPRTSVGSANLNQYKNFADFQQQYTNAADSLYGPLNKPSVGVTRSLTEPQQTFDEAAAFRAAGIATTPAELQAQAARLGPVGGPVAPEREASLLDQLKKSTGLSEDTLKKLGIAGITGLIGSRQTQAAREGAQAGRQELESVAAPYRQKGLQLQAQAQQGALTPQGQQSLQAVQAQAAQQAQRRGGVGAAQTQQQVEAYRQQLLAQQYDLGLKISGIGDQIALGAIRTGMQADQYVNQLTTSYYTNIARSLYGVAPETAQQQRGA